MPITLTPNKTTAYKPGDFVSIAVAADAVPDVNTVVYTVTASRTVDGQVETASLDIPVNYPVVVTAVTVDYGDLPLAPNGFEKFRHEGYIPTQPPAA